MGNDRGGAVLALGDVVAGDTNYSLSDIAANFADDEGNLLDGLEELLGSAAEVTISDQASVAQATAVWYSFPGTLILSAGLTDQAENYAAADGTPADPFLVLLMSATISEATISDVATIAQAALLWNNISGALNLAAGLSDTAEHYADSDGALADGVAELLALGPEAFVTDAASIAQLTAISETAVGSLSYASIADTASNLASYTEADGWEASSFITDGIEVTVLGPIAPDLIELVDTLNGDAKVTTDPALLSAPNTYLVATQTSLVLEITGYMVATVIDAPGAHEIRVAANGKLNLIGSDGHNVIYLEDRSMADVIVTHSGGTAIVSLAADASQIASIATDASYAPAQTLSFSDGNIELRNDGSLLAFDGIEVALVGILL